MSDASGTTSGRNDSECGAMGVSSVLGTLGATMGPPALSEYAVDPDGVAMIKPSACAARAEPQILHPYKCYERGLRSARSTGRRMSQP